MTISVQGGFSGGVGPGPYMGPGDVIGPSYRWYGLRAFKASLIPNACVSLERASDGTSQTINSIVSGLIDVAAASTFLFSTTGTTRIFFDQSGNGQVLNSNPLGFNFPTFVISDGTSRPCFRMLRANKQGAQISGSFANLSQPFSYAGVYVDNNAPGDLAVFFGATQQGITPERFYTNGASPGTVSMSAGTALNNNHSSQGILHDFVAVFNGASSHIYIDGVDAAGNAGAANAINNIWSLGGADVTETHWTGDGKEVGIWNRVITATEAANYHTNARTFWGY